MKIITLKQPWATLVAEGIKKYEFRSWKINYRGKLLIHAGAGVDKEELKKFKKYNLDFPKSKILAIAEVEDCLKLDDELNKKIIAEKNEVYDNKSRTGYAWKLKNIKKVKVDLEVKGKLGLWTYDINEEELKTL